ncbi:MAG TPA: hypothetical protein VHP38_01550 [Ruminiclostridium sp.]|nr:hypothetical protein [Ruminiclostridium sp.]
MVYDKKISCENKIKDEKVCIKLMVVDEAKTDMEYGCNSCK